MNEELTTYLQQAAQRIIAAEREHDLAVLKAEYIGKKSRLVDLQQQLAAARPEDKRALGQVVNQYKTAIVAAVDARLEQLKQQALAARLDNLDVTMPGQAPKRGALHPITRIWWEMEDIFMSMGFEVGTGPEVEDEFHNFDALNTPADHPARNLADTFYTKNGKLLRTHTSTVQIRVMEKFAPPLRMISPGRCFRNDKPDASHMPSFHQMEGLVVDENVTFADLRATLDQFVQKMFGARAVTRFRPHFFPFTEPSAEMDMTCFMCGGKGCPACKGSGWIEMGGAGMIDPNVLRAVNLDPEKYNGFAFGLGMDRMAMLRYNVPDIRLLFDNDLRYITQG